MPRRGFFNLLAVSALALLSPRPAIALTADGVMDDDAFWAIVEATAVHEANTDQQTRALFAALSRLSAADVVAFNAAFERKMAEAYTWDLWAVDYIAHGGASDDGFQYFRCWLISKGRGLFDRLLAEPDDLGVILAPDSRGVLEYEDFATVAWDVWAAKTGREPEDIPMDAETTSAMSADPSGEPFSEDPAELAARFPRTWARFGRHPLG